MSVDLREYKKVVFVENWGVAYSLIVELLIKVKERTICRNVFNDQVNKKIIYYKIYKYKSK